MAKLLKGSATLTGLAHTAAVVDGNQVSTGALDAGSITSGFGTIDTGSSTITTTGALAAGTLDTGQGANELYDMDQNVLTTSSPTFAGFAGNAGQITAKAWVNFEGTGATSIRDSHNVSSVTDESGNGAYTLNFTAMADSNYAVICTGSQPMNIGLDTGTYSTTQAGLVSRNTTTSGGTRADSDYVCCVIYGDQ